MISRFILVCGVLGLGALTAPLGAQDAARPAPAADRATSSRKGAGRVVPVASLAGQSVAVLPVTLLAAEPALKRDSLYDRYRDRQAALALVDSTIGAALTERGPEVQWVLPPELRKMARRSPGLVKSPDDLGHAVLRSPRYKEVPEPMRGDLRNLVAVSGGRVVLVPAALGFVHDKDSHQLRADLALVLVDARAGKVLWRSVTSGTGATLDAALETALANALPLDLPTP